MALERIAGLQKLGRALMLPIAVLPIAGLLLRLGQPDLLNLPFMAAAGNAVFSHLGLLFAVGIAVGFAKENHGAAGLAGAIGYFVTIEGAGVIVGGANVAKEMSRMSVPVGIVSGLVAGALYNRFKDIKLPEYLAFFGGRRFVPIVTGFFCLGLAAIFGYGFPLLAGGLDRASDGVIASGDGGLFTYGFLNRILLVTGLHHIVNNFAWFNLGEFGGVTGDLNRFVAGDPSAGAFMAGFFPVMMFGLPAACLAMYRSARTENRRMVAGMLFSIALTSFLTGVTEPVEFAFMFLAPFLYLIHAVLTGLSHVIMSMLNVKLGFSFSAGAFDYILYYNKATNPLLLLPVGAGYFIIYYSLFRFVIQRFDLKTPGREDAKVVATASAGAPVQIDPFGGGLPAAVVLRAPSRSERYLAALGGAANIQDVDACATRLRLSVVDGARVDEAALKEVGARGVIRLTAGSVQVIVGPVADQVADEIRQTMRELRPAIAP